MDTTPATKPRFRVRRGAQGNMEYAEVPAGLSIYSQAYLGGDRTMQGKILNWFPVPQSADREVLQNRSLVQERVRDLGRNNEWISGGFERKADTVVGASLRLVHKPLYRIMERANPAMNKEWGNEFSRAAEAIFTLWADDMGKWCDTQRHYNFGGLMRFAFIQSERDGEVFLIVHYDDPADRGGQFGTHVEVIDTTRVSNPDAMPDGWHTLQGDNGPVRVNLKGGVVTDANGAEVGFFVRTRYPGEVEWDERAGVDRWDFVPRETPWGRPVGIHYYNKSRADQRRGISRMASGLRRAKMLDRADEAELEAMVLAAVMSLYVKSNASPEQVADMLAPASGEEDVTREAVEDARVEFYRRNPVISGSGARVPVLPPQDELVLETAGRDHKGYIEYQSSILRALASAMGTTYEQLSLDFSRTTYSSARAALGEIWKSVVSERTNFCRAVPTPIFSCVTEEAVLDGRIVLPDNAPDFDMARSAYCTADWIGPPRGVIDQIKQSESDEKDEANGFESFQKICAERGVDWREQIEEIAEARQYATQLGVTIGKTGRDTALAEAESSARQQTEAQVEGALEDQRT